MEADDQPKIRTKHGELTLEEIASLLPGTADVMAVVSRVYGNLWHAAEGGNWDLASFYFRRTRKLLRELAITRPAYSRQLRDYQKDFLEVVGAALEARDLPRFETAYQAGVTRANELHVETGYPYIRWQRPELPPDPGLDLGAGPTG